MDAYKYAKVHFDYCILVTLDLSTFWQTCFIKYKNAQKVGVV